MEYLIGLIVTIFPLIPVNNWFMSMVKFGYTKSLSSTWLRAILVMFSLIGVLAYSAVFDEPVDFNKVSELVTLLVEVLGLSVASHFSYKMIKFA